MTKLIETFYHYRLDLPYGVFLVVITYVLPFAHSLYCHARHGRDYESMISDRIEAICKDDKCLYLSKCSLYPVAFLPLLVFPCMALSFKIVFGVYSGFKLIWMILILIFVTIGLPLAYYNYKYVLCLVTGKFVYIKSVQTMFRLRCIPVESIVEYSVFPVFRGNPPGVKIVTSDKKYTVGGVKNIEELFPVLDALHVKRKFSNWGWY